MGIPHDYQNLRDMCNTCWSWRCRGFLMKSSSGWTVTSSPVRSLSVSELISLHVPFLTTFRPELRFTTWFAWSRLLWLIQGWWICQKLRLVPRIWSLPPLKRALVQHWWGWCFEHLRSFDAKVWVGCPWWIKERVRIWSRRSNIVERTLQSLWCIVAYIRRWTDMGNYRGTCWLKGCEQRTGAWQCSQNTGFHGIFMLPEAPF